MATVIDLLAAKREDVRFPWPLWRQPEITTSEQSGPGCAEGGAPTRPIPNFEDEAEALAKLPATGLLSQALKLAHAGPGRRLEANLRCGTY